MKSKITYYKTLLLISLFFLSCKSDNKTEIKKTKIIKAQKNKSLDTKNFETVSNVSVFMYGPYDNRVGFSSLNGYTINVKKNSSYVRYNIGYEGLYRDTMKDSILIHKDENKYILNFFLTDNKELKETYWDSVSEGRVRKIYFLNDEEAVVKQLAITGNPHFINNLKESCDFLFEKVKKKDSAK
ncbi:hypothetical protein IRZ71_04815 [Flavobacterium sp. ANB]|uniref:hypothetical protein n=1 Tax=unclassified Flavobacterium TaxID=196869 RepID=UPI0012B7B39A|nr:MULTISPECIES: hypothetical protein [unclassified Flavobacterium]MBF4515649.1 hypothetical protein [Flavobacterium sp. ANB]MTD68652.1 hypothetical protein [Flavobacterium sp. LC2016-13]